MPVRALRDVAVRVVAMLVEMVLLADVGDVVLPASELAPDAPVVVKDRVPEHLQVEITMDAAIVAPYVRRVRHRVVIHAKPVAVEFVKLIVVMTAVAVPVLVVVAVKDHAVVTVVMNAVLDVVAHVVQNVPDYVVRVHLVQERVILLVKERAIPHVQIIVVALVKTDAMILVIMHVADSVPDALIVRVVIKPVDLVLVHHSVLLVAVDAHHRAKINAVNYVKVNVPVVTEIVKPHVVLVVPMNVAMIAKMIALAHVREHHHRLSIGINTSY